MNVQIQFLKTEQTGKMKMPLCAGQAFGKTGSENIFRLKRPVKINNGYLNGLHCPPI